MTQPARARTARTGHTASQVAGRAVCIWCGRAFAPAGGPGRPRLFCKRACRQRDYEARRRAAELGLNEHELVVTRDVLEQLRDRLFVLERSLADADDDLRRPEARRARELRRIMDYVMTAARECVAPAEPEGAP